MPMPMPTDLLVLLFWSGSAQEGHDLGEHEQTKAASQSVRQFVSYSASQAFIEFGCTISIVAI